MSTMDWEFPSGAYLFIFVSPTIKSTEMAGRRRSGEEEE